MATIITKYSDFIINSIEYFIDTIEDELNARDLKGLFNDKIQVIKVTKQHPIVSLMAAQLQENKNLDAIRSGLLPAISVTPSNPAEEGFTLGQGYKTELVDDEFIEQLRVFLNRTNKERLQDVLLTTNQIELIMSEYRKRTAGSVRAQIHEWRKNEELSISVWSETPDIDYVLGLIMDSVLADIQVGFAGDNSKMQYMKWKPTKGLTNFNFGRVIFGTEYSLTFMNTYNNYTIYYDDVISEHDFEATFEIPDEE